MSTLAVETHPLADNVELTDNDMVVSLVDGRKIMIPWCGSRVWQMPQEPNWKITSF